MRRNKYGAKKTTCRCNLCGRIRKFDSQFEAAVFHWLALQERGGGIRSLQHHAGRILLTRAKIEIRPDFEWEKGGERIYGEAKGKETALWRLKRRLWQVYGPGPLHVITGRPASIKVKEIIIPGTGK